MAIVQSLRAGVSSLASLVLLTCLFSAGAWARDESRGVVRSSTDRFTGTTTYEYRGIGERPIASGRSPGLEFQAQAFVKSSAGDDRITASIFISYFGRGWRYLRCQNLNWLVDGRPVELSKPNAVNDVMYGGRVAEIIVQSLTIEQLAMLGRANSVEFKLCNDEVALRQEDIAAMAEIARLASGIQAPQGSGATQPESPADVAAPTAPASSYNNTDAGRKFASSIGCPVGFNELSDDGRRAIFETTCANTRDRILVECVAGQCSKLR